MPSSFLNIIHLALTSHYHYQHIINHNLLLYLAVIEKKKLQQKMSTSPPKKILITGASGYVGQHLTASIGFLGLKDNDNNKGRRYQLYCTYHSLDTYEDDLKLIFDENQRLL